MEKQPQELLAAFGRINDICVREQLLILIEIISERPGLIAQLTALDPARMVH